MRPKLLLRIASALLFFKTFGHTLYVCTWADTTDPVQKEVVRQMTEYNFPFGGTSRSAGDYYSGFGYSLSVAFILIAVLLWMVSGEMNLSAKLPKKIIFTIAITLLAMGVVEVILFFPFIAGLSIVAGALTLTAGLMLKRKSS